MPMRLHGWRSLEASTVFSSSDTFLPCFSELETARTRPVYSLQKKIERNRNLRHRWLSPDPQLWFYSGWVGLASSDQRPRHRLHRKFRRRPSARGPIVSGAASVAQNEQMSRTFRGTGSKVLYRRPYRQNADGVPMQRGEYCESTLGKAQFRAREDARGSHPKLIAHR
jgi:hypothetical protein